MKTKSIKKSGKFIVLCLTVAIIMSIACVCNAASENFDKKFVDSNQWTSVSSLEKEIYTEVATVRINDIFLPNGDPSNYSKVKAVAGFYDNEVKLAYKNANTDLPLVQGFGHRNPGVTLSLFLMGNNPNKDCKVSGCWNVY